MDKLINDEHLSDIADAIRMMNGTDDTYKPREMAGAILDIPYVINKLTLTSSQVISVSPLTIQLTNEQYALFEDANQQFINIDASGLGIGYTGSQISYDGNAYSGSAIVPMGVSSLGASHHKLFSYFIIKASKQMIIYMQDIGSATSDIVTEDTTGDISLLNTTDKSNIVSAINEVNQVAGDVETSLQQIQDMLPKAIEIAIEPSEWVNSSCTKTTDKNGNLIPVLLNSIVVCDYSDYHVFCSSQSVGSLTFSAVDNVPVSDVNIKVIIMPGNITTETVLFDGIIPKEDFELENDGTYSYAKGYPGCTAKAGDHINVTVNGTLYSDLTVLALSESYHGVIIEDTFMLLFTSPIDNIDGDGDGFAISDYPEPADDVAIRIVKLNGGNQ